MVLDFSVPYAGHHRPILSSSILSNLAIGGDDSGHLLFIQCPRSQNERSDGPLWTSVTYYWSVTTCLSRLHLTRGDPGWCNGFLEHPCLASDWRRFPGRTLEVIRRGPNCGSGAPRRELLSWGAKKRTTFVLPVSVHEGRRAHSGTFAESGGRVLYALWHGNLHHRQSRYNIPLSTYKGMAIYRER